MDESHNIDWNLIRRQLEGNISNEELQSFNEWLNEDERNREIFNRAKAIWHVLPPTKSEWNQKKAYDSVWQKIRSEELKNNNNLEESGSFAVPNHIYNVRNNSWTVQLMKVAAVLLIGIITAITLYYSGVITQKKSIPKLTFQTIASASGQIVKFTLPDGTKVEMAPESQIRIPSNYDQPRREIFLKGEAYFKVLHSASHPFEIRLHNTIVRDLGTKFDLQSYPSDEFVKVVVSQGKVSLRSERIVKSNPIIVKAGFMGVINYPHKITSVDKVDTTQFMGWRKGRLRFNDAPFSQITQSLERWYGLKAVKYSKSIAALRISTHFSSRQPINDVVQALALSVDLNYRIRKDTLFFYQKRKS